MKRFLTFLVLVLTGYSVLLAQNVTIPDQNFLSTLIAIGIDTNGDSQISVAEAEAVTSLDVGSESTGQTNIADLTGIEAFINLTSLNCSGNKVNTLDLSSNVNTATRFLI